MEVSTEEYEEVIIQLGDMGFGRAHSQAAVRDILRQQRKVAFDSCLEWVLSNEAPATTPAEPPTAPAADTRKRKVRSIPLSLQHLFAQLQLMNSRTIPTEVRLLRAYCYLIM